MIPAFVIFILAALVAVMILGGIRIVLVRRRILAERRAQQNIEFISHMEAHEDAYHIRGGLHADEHISSSNPLHRQTTMDRFFEALFAAELTPNSPFRVMDDSAAVEVLRGDNDGGRDSTTIIPAVVLFNATEESGVVDTSFFPEAENLLPLGPPPTAAPPESHRSPRLRNASGNNNNGHFPRHASGEDPAAFGDEHDGRQRSASDLYGCAEYIHRVAPLPVTADDNDDRQSTSHSVVLAELPVPSPRMVNQHLSSTTSRSVGGFPHLVAAKLRVATEDTTDEVAFSPSAGSDGDVVATI